MSSFKAKSKFTKSIAPALPLAIGGGGYKWATAFNNLDTLGVE